MFYEALALLYFTVCLIVCDDKKLNCGLDDRHCINDFLKAVLWPTLAMRFAGFLKYKDVSYSHLRDCLFFVDSYRTVAFGLWTIFNIIKLINLPVDYKCLE